MQKTSIQLIDGIEVMKFDDGTWIIYGEEKEDSFILNGSASRALELALQYGIQEGFKVYLEQVKKEFDDVQVLREAEEDYYYILDVCKTKGFVDINTI